MPGRFPETRCGSVSYFWYRCTLVFHSTSLRSRVILGRCEVVRKCCQGPKSIQDICNRLPWQSRNRVREFSIIMFEHPHVCPSLLLCYFPKKNNISRISTLAGMKTTNEFTKVENTFCNIIGKRCNVLQLIIFQNSMTFHEFHNQEEHCL